MSLEVVFERAAFGGVPVIGGLAMPAMNLNEEVSHPPLGEWDGDAAKAARKKFGR